jgi:glyoxylase-like metal-dependent hydrolase (beta-lactamase superfamily II)
MNYTITSLMVGRVLRDKTWEKAHTPPDMGVRVKRPNHVFLVEPEGGGDKILVDAGCPSAADGAEAWAPPEFNQPLPDGGGSEGVRAALESVGVRPQDIKRVILTHGWIEHAWNIDMFPDAQAIIQRDEVECMFAPVPWQRLMYYWGHDKPYRAALDIQMRRKPFQCLLLWGDTEIADGITCMKVPGKTFGMQVPVIQTAKGKVAICNAGSTYANWFPNDGRFGFALRPLIGTFNKPGNYVLHEWKILQEMHRLRAAADIIVPAEDPAIPKKMPEQWWDSPSDAEVQKANTFEEMPFKPGLY